MCTNICTHILMYTHINTRVISIPIFIYSHRIAYLLIIPTQVLVRRKPCSWVTGTAEPGSHRIKRRKMCSLCGQTFLRLRELSLRNPRLLVPSAGPRPPQAAPCWEQACLWEGLAGHSLQASMEVPGSRNEISQQLMEEYRGSELDKPNLHFRGGTGRGIRLP